MAQGEITIAVAREWSERRRRDRRASGEPARSWLDPLFAATLIKQITPDEAPTAHYRGPKGPRAGIAFDLSA